MGWKRGACLPEEVGEDRGVARRPARGRPPRMYFSPSATADRRELVSEAVVLCGHIYIYIYMCVSVCIHKNKVYKRLRIYV